MFLRAIILFIFCFTTFPNAMASSSRLLAAKNYVLFILDSEKNHIEYLEALNGEKPKKTDFILVLESELGLSNTIIFKGPFEESVSSKIKDKVKFALNRLRSQNNSILNQLGFEYLRTAEIHLEYVLLLLELKKISISDSRLLYIEESVMEEFQKALDVVIHKARREVEESLIRFKSINREHKIFINQDMLEKMINDFLMLSFFNTPHFSDSETLLLQKEVGIRLNESENDYKLRDVIRVYLDINNDKLNKAFNTTMCSSLFF